jgi:hypothetical protein
MVAGASAEVARARLGDVPGQLGHAPPGESIMATPVGGPQYLIRRSWRDLAEGELPDRTVLDRAAPGHPIFSQARARVVAYVCARNSLALDRLGITSAAPDRVGNVWIEKDAAGQPTGRLRASVANYYCASPFMHDLLRQLPLLPPDAIMPGTERAMHAVARVLVNQGRRGPDRAGCAVGRLLSVGHTSGTALALGRARTDSLRTYGRLGRSYTELTAN